MNTRKGGISLEAKAKENVGEKCTNQVLIPKSIWFMYKKNNSQVDYKLAYKNMSCKITKYLEFAL